jgi:hypothetical protein
MCQRLVPAGQPALLHKNFMRTGFVCFRGVPQAHEVLFLKFKERNRL